MSSRRFVAALLCLGGSTVIAADIGGAVTTAASAVVPVDQIPVPPPRVEASAAPAPILSGNIVVLSFELLGDVRQRDWIATGLQRTLSAEVAKIGGFTPLLGAPPVGAIDAKAAAAVAKAAGGEVVVFGTCQFSGTLIRITGEVVDVKTGRAIRGLKASGAYTDLFDLEDILSSQLTHTLKPPAPVVASNASPALQAQLPAGPIPAGPNPAMVYYATPTDAQRFADQYSHYYYAQPPLLPIYGGGFGLPYYPGFENQYIVVVGHGRDRDHDGDRLPGRVASPPIVNSPAPQQNGPPTMGQNKGVRKPL